MSDAGDRLLCALSDAGRRARVLGGTCIIPDPLATTMRALSDADFMALVSLVADLGITTGGGPYVHQDRSGSIPPPTRRLLEPFFGAGNAHVSAETTIASQLRSTDTEAFAALTGAIATEQSRRA